MQNKQKGFTLIELMVTIAVMVIIAMMAAPSFNTMIMNQNLKSSTDSLVQEIKLVRSKAVLDKREIKLVLASTNADSPTVLNWSPKGQVRLKTANNKEVKFDGSGILTSFGELSVIELCQKNGASPSKKITLTALGQIEKIEEGSCP